MNLVILTGRLGADPEQCFTGSGREVSNFRMVTSEYWHNKEGERMKSVEWHNIRAWGKLATTVGKYLAKGRQVTVTGKLKTRKWTDRDNNVRYTTEIEARNIEFLDNGNGHAKENQAVHAAPMEAEASNAGVPEASMPSNAQLEQEANAYVNDQDVPY